MAALEVLVVTPAVANLIREGKTVQLPAIMQTSKALGMSLLNDELARMIETHKVEMDEALAAAADKEDLLRRFRTGLTLAQDSMADETFRVVSVAPSSPGAQAGVSRGDILIELDGRRGQGVHPRGGAAADPHRRQAQPHRRPRRQARQARDGAGRPSRHAGGRCRRCRRAHHPETALSRKPPGGEAGSTDDRVHGRGPRRLRRATRCCVAVRSGA